MTKSYYIETSCAMNCIANCMTKDIAPSLVDEVIKLMSHS